MRTAVLLVGATASSTAAWSVPAHISRVSTISMMGDEQVEISKSKLKAAMPSVAAEVRAKMMMHDSEGSSFDWAMKLGKPKSSSATDPTPLDATEGDPRFDVEKSNPRTRAVTPRPRTHRPDAVPESFDWATSHVPAYTSSSYGKSGSKLGQFSSDGVEMMQGLQKAHSTHTSMKNRIHAPPRTVATPSNPRPAAKAGEPFGFGFPDEGQMDGWPKADVVVPALEEQSPPPKAQAKQQVKQQPAASKGEHAVIGDFVNAPRSAQAPPAAAPAAATPPAAKPAAAANVADAAAAEAKSSGKTTKAAAKAEVEVATPAAKPAATKPAPKPSAKQAAKAAKAAKKESAKAAKAKPAAEAKPAAASKAAAKPAPAKAAAAAKAEIVVDAATVESLKAFLARLDLSPMEKVFVEEGITTVEDLRLLNESDLKELGCNMGARKKIPRALAGSAE